MKKIISLMLCFLLVVLASACNSNNENNSAVLNSASDSKSESSTSVEEVIEKPIYVSPTGDGSGIDKENTTSLNVALTKLDGINFCSIVLEPGEYTMQQQLQLAKSGNATTPLQLICVNGFAKLNFNKLSAGLYIRGNYWKLKGIEAYKSTSNGIKISGNHNIIERCITCFNGNSGLQISGSSEKTIDYWPSYNQIINCTSFANRDAEGDDADGFACKITSGVGNSFDGCISYKNSDDGWDLFTKRATGAIGSVSLTNCVAFLNGLSMNEDGSEIIGKIGDGNGFKLGGRAIEVNHTVTNCVAFSNCANGFDDNSNPGTLKLTNCTSYNNGKKNFSTGRFTEDDSTYNSTWLEGSVLYGPINHINKSHNIFKNLISYSIDEFDKDTYVGVASNCYFFSGLVGNYYSIIGEDILVNTNSTSTKGTPVNISSSPFVSNQDVFTDYLNIDNLMRNSKGEINLKDFLKSNEEFKNYGAKLFN